VHVPVGVVAGDPAAEPHDLPDSEKIAKDLFVAAPVETGIARLDLGVEKTLLRREERPLSVDIDRAPLEYDVAPAGGGAKGAGVFGFHNTIRQPRVLAKVAIARPAIEGKARHGHLAGTIVDQERRAGVAGPSTVGREGEELDAGGVGARALQDPADALFVG